MFDLLNILGAASFVLTIIALHLLGRPDRRTFPVFLVSIIIQAIIFYSTKQWFLLGQMVVLFGYNIRNWESWKKQGVG